jgi:hypothetical protein
MDLQLKFRADYFGYQFWSTDYTIPGALSDVLTIAHQDMTVTANQVHGLDIDPLEGVNVYLFTGTGSYQGIHQATDNNGQVVFHLPQMDYKARADYLSAQYWSDVFSWKGEWGTHLIKKKTIYESANHSLPLEHGGFSHIEIM